MSERDMTFTYRNYRGEISERTVLRPRLYWGSTKWHPKKQWLMEAFDITKDTNRIFAFKDIITPPAPTVQEAKTAPVQRFKPRIPWSLHLEAHNAYVAEYGKGQSADRIAERGGFGIGEMDMFVPGWRYQLSEIGLLREAIVRYGDHSRMATVEPPQLQQVIDDAFANTPSRAALSNGEQETGP